MKLSQLWVLLELSQVWGLLELTCLFLQLDLQLGYCQQRLRPQIEAERVNDTFEW
ncbi:unnamed protein product [Hymenolepis diminuta]|uniref:Uncharacterized protein n=1 Tax=Hymenolepis diminuta TaxID=6216 RepID=A0A564ZCT9_HYMDI|nr:unnamed protein product [Hymenolepis diminuta]